MTEIYHGDPLLPDRSLRGRVFLFVSALRYMASRNGFRGPVNHLSGCHFIQRALLRRRNKCDRQSATVFVSGAT